MSTACTSWILPFRKRYKQRCSAASDKRKEYDWPSTYYLGKWQQQRVAQLAVPLLEMTQVQILTVVISRFRAAFFVNFGFRRHISSPPSRSQSQTKSCTIRLTVLLQVQGLYWTHYSHISEVAWLPVRMTLLQNWRIYVRPYIVPIDIYGGI